MFPLGVLRKKASQGADPNLTLALLHFDTDFSDSSIYTRSFVSAGGTPSVSATQSKFGGKSLYLNGSSAIKTPDNANLHIGSSDFTFEFWLYLPTISGSNMGVFSKRSNGSTNIDYYCYIGTTGRVQFSFSTNGTSIASGVSSVNPIPTAQFVHIAIVRNATVIKVYVNGVVDGTGIILGTCFDGVADLIIGSLNPPVGLPLTGYIDEFRIRKEAVYTGDFTPPTAPFTY